MSRVLITGGAGFIGSHLADELLRAGHEVRALDNLVQQVHPRRERPAYLSPEVELVVGDVRHPRDVEQALVGVDAVVHLAAMVGVGQSMSEVALYTEVNNLGTAVLLEALAKHPVVSLVVASSMSVYGEGLYETKAGRRVEGMRRSIERLGVGLWEPAVSGLDDDQMLSPLPTPETKRPDPASVYALSKWDQERMCLMVGEQLGIPTAALRFFNAFGSRQALTNPYTGVLAIFASRLLAGERPVIFEDGKQRRDFVHVSDVARACRLALESPEAAGRSFNIASGASRSVTEVAESISAALGLEILPLISGQHRPGDIRHCFADCSLAEDVLGFRALTSFEDGIQELTSWLPRTT